MTLPFPNVSLALAGACGAITHSTVWFLLLLHDVLFRRLLLICGAVAHALVRPLPEVLHGPQTLT